MFLSAKNRCLPVGRQSIPLVWIFDHYSFHLKSQTNGNTEEDIQQTGRPPCPERQEYRLTVRYNTELHLRLKALARQSGQRPVEVVRQLIAYG